MAKNRRKRRKILQGTKIRQRTKIQGTKMKKEKANETRYENKLKIR